uniref:MHYT domain-containing protein n=1 Tax=Chromera velia CCMP2878 TaxID=1169474 RepID=A0A0G4FZV3_9ALVE|eukprot:Cvel_19560.t1-p1 / transcript=Cvel_19560.t1 / gene=Cvel_19560 / organism=Chromera_velia_CCMP2878 / gene_product=Uncharacterized signaling protein PA1727, putative / transcript_product=Uncharacterized signaling protein PA1727, putative / location=Cvel_scaffold1696:3818-5713(+) / protein_length=449 / sequence_SO=supercontig / SO=protein_coding / is_pseudo=false
MGEQPTELNFVCEGRDWRRLGHCPYKDGEELQYVFLPELVALSIIYAFLGSYLGLNFADNLKEVSGGAWYYSFSLQAGLAIGICGVWTMHFFGMVSLLLGSKDEVLNENSLYNTPHVARVTILFNVFWTVCSAVIVAISGACAFLIMTWRKKRATIEWSWWRLGASAFFLGSGVILMHFFGMAAQGGKFRMEFHWVFILVSCVLAYVVSAVGMVILFFFKQTVLTRILAACVIAVAVCSVHYTGMLSAKYYFWADGPEEGGVWIKVNTQIVSLSSAFLALCLSAIENTYARQRLQNLRSLSRRVLEEANTKTLKSLKTDHRMQRASIADCTLHKMLEDAGKNAPSREIAPIAPANLEEGRGTQYIVGRPSLESRPIREVEGGDGEAPERVAEAAGGEERRSMIPVTDTGEDEEECNVEEDCCDHVNLALSMRLPPQPVIMVGENPNRRK